MPIHFRPASPIDYHVDWSQDWATDEAGRFVLRYILVEHAKEVPFTILTDIYVFCNEEATTRYNQFKDAGLDWVGRLMITEVLCEYGEKHDLRLMLTSQREHDYEFAVMDRKNGRCYDVVVRARWLGQDTGNDILVSITNHFKRLKDYIKVICRPLSKEEQKTLFSLMSAN